MLRYIFSVCPALGYVRISSFPIRRGHIQSTPLWLSVVIASVQLATPATTTTTIPPLATVTTTMEVEIKFKRHDFSLGNPIKNTHTNTHTQRKVPHDKTIIQ